MVSIYTNTSPTSFLRAAGTPAPVARLTFSSDNPSGKQEKEEHHRNIKHKQQVIFSSIIFSKSNTTRLFHHNFWLASAWGGVEVGGGQKTCKKP